MRNVARLKMGYYPLPEAEGVKLCSLLSFAGPASVIDPCVGQGTALHLVTSDAQVRRYGVELDAERARIAGANGIETIQGNAFDAIARPESFSLLYLNPPYDSEIGSIANRRMEAIFLEHTYRWLAMEGVLILVIPFERLHDCAGILASHFTQLAVLRMTDEESVKYRQIAVLGRPITPLHGGHVGLLCTAGLLNGVFGQGDDRHIARWRSVKHVTTFVEQDGDTEIIHHRERWANELYLVYADGRTLKLTETPAKKEGEADGECTPAVRAA